MSDALDRFWSLPAADVLRRLDATPRGLAGAEASRRLERVGPNVLQARKRTGEVGLLLSQFKSPLILILLFAAGLSFFLHDPADALIILGIVLASGVLGFWQERGAAHAVDKLLAVVQTKATALRDGAEKEIPVAEIVPGDVVVLSAGKSIPGDCLVLESNDLFLDEATLTGETYPIEKKAGTVAADVPLGQRANTLFMGTHVVSGSAAAAVVRTGTATEFGKVAERLRLRSPETEFERGVRRFGYLLMEVTLVLVIAIFAINVSFHRPVLEAFIFSLAVAVGLTPQLLPAIISINLAHGAKRMAVGKVIVRRLSSIENFGSMNVLCCDKTGTLTEGVVRVHSALNVEGQESEEVLRYAYLNAFFETGLVNPIDEAIRTYRRFDLGDCRKLDEVPYDFIRKRLSVLVADKDRHVLVTKGALAEVLAVCAHGENGRRGGRPDRRGPRPDRPALRGSLQPGIPHARHRVARHRRAVARHQGPGVGHGVRRPAGPLRPAEGRGRRHDHRPEAPRRVRQDDHRRQPARGGPHQRAGRALEPTAPERHGPRRMSDEALLGRVNGVDVFAEIEPNQKERIILALRKAGNVVGYMGDGINDASALHAADVGISVESAVDVAKEAADIVLLERDLGVLVQGVQEGRITFANTLKYVFMATSANFGNMFSMAGVSLFLPFLPLLPKQILLTNLMTDFPEMTIATDAVDAEMVERPRRWDTRFIRNFMMTFGLVSSIFDYATFGVLHLLGATAQQFRTGWFLESVVSASLIVLVVRTRRPFFLSRPSRPLAVTTGLVVAVTLALPYTPLAAVFGFVPLGLQYLGPLAGVVALYIVTAELAKRRFYRL